MARENMKTPEDICPDFPEWPESWHGVEEDIPYGQGLVAVMRPFVLHLIDNGLARKTIRKHMDYLWLLGGEIIRDVGMDEEYDIAPEEKLRQSVDEEGGPYCRHLDSKNDMRAFDATCRKFHKFLNPRS